MASTLGHGDAKSAEAKSPRPQTEGVAANAQLDDKIHAQDILPPDHQRHRETFLPVTRAALVDRLTKPQAWNAGEARQAAKFFQYLAYWRKQRYGAANMAVEQDYEPFNPDTDLLQTRQFTDLERYKMQKRLVAHMEHLLTQANFVRVAPTDVEIIMTAETHYGLDFHVDLDAFEELLVFYRGASTRKDQQRTLRRFYRKSEIKVPVYQRLFILFKLKPDAVRIEEIMRQKKIGRKQATKFVKKLRSRMPEGVRTDNIYMKMFRDMPRADIEMIFPNTRVKFRLMDKLKLGVTGGAGVAGGVMGSAGKIALIASNPIPAALAIMGLGGVAVRQVMGAFNQHQRYMVVMAQNLYFHALADNRGVLFLLGDNAAEEDVKEEILLYSVLSKEKVNRADLPDVDRAIEQYLRSTFGIDVDFDVEDALDRLIADGIVTMDPDGTLHALPPAEAAEHIDTMWDLILDNLPDVATHEGTEFVGRAGGARHGPPADVGPAAMPDAAQ
ncbi:MAG: TMEM143 family protein [Pseudomonadota bacterium]